jgi:predicted transcriptional regulator
MNDTTPLLHPMEREQLRAESTLVVTVKASSEYRDDLTDRIEALERGDAVDSTPTLRSH